MLWQSIEKMEVLMMEIDSIDSKATKYRTYFSKMVRLSA